MSGAEGLEFDNVGDDGCDLGLALTSCLRGSRYGAPATSVRYAARCGIRLESAHFAVRVEGNRQKTGGRAPGL